MVERNLAKVEVESSRLFSRSIFTVLAFPGLAVAAIVRAMELDDRSGEKTAVHVRARFFAGQCRGGNAPMVKLVDTADLKSAASLNKGRTGSIPVRGTRLGSTERNQHGTL